MIFAHSFFLSLTDLRRDLMILVAWLFGSFSICCFFNRFNKQLAMTSFQCLDILFVSHLKSDVGYVDRIINDLLNFQVEETIINSILFSKDRHLFLLQHLFPPRTNNLTF